MMSAKLFELSAYENELNKTYLSPKDIETQIKHYKLTFIQVRNQEVEWGMKIPTLITPFYDFLFKNNLVPNQNEYWDAYVKFNASYFAGAKHNANITEGIRARIYRTYPSLVRDIHFGKIVSQNLIECNVLYNEKLDLEEGIDLLVSKDSEFWGINLFTETYRARVGREKKKNRHVNFENVRYIDIPVDFKGSTVCGDFYLYGEKESNKIKAAIGM